MSPGCGDSGATYCRSVATALGRLRSRFNTTISRAHFRTIIDNKQAEPTAPAPITPTFMFMSFPCTVSVSLSWPSDRSLYLWQWLLLLSNVKPSRNPEPLLLVDLLFRVSSCVRSEWYV